MDWKKAANAKSSEKHKFHLNWLFQKLSSVRCTHSKDHFDLIRISQYNLQSSVFSHRKLASVGKRNFSLILKLKRILEISGVTFKQLEKLLLSLWFVLVLKCNVINFVQRLLLSSALTMSNKKKYYSFFILHAIGNEWQEITFLIDFEL